MMLLSLAVSDLLMVVSMLFNSIMIMDGEWRFSNILCKLVSSLALTLCFISILHLCLLSFDRYIRIKKPLRYQHLISQRTVTVLMVLIWLVPSLVVNLPYADFEFRSSVYGCLKDSSHRNPSSTFLLVIIFVILPFSVLFYIYAYFFKVVREHARRIVDAAVNNVHETSHRHLRLFARQQVKSIKTFAFVIGTFLLCYTPFFLLGTYVSSKGSGTISADVMSLVTWLAFCNSFCNPVVYSLRYRNFRESFRNILCSPQTIMTSRQTDNVRNMRTVGKNNLNVSPL
ncbi:octopamine receptor 1-like [Dendronephthya gigantea]|uniref:octopamine receptor 1-like n=1 Tax=Dendronephthya gigantea TaxID=151771 RepID=UPI001069A411|nr:octopamine receptor 1-like [Dendronephthya gigantea]